MRPSIEKALFLDCETRVEQGYSLGRMSTRAYIEDSRFDLLSCAIALGSNDIAFFYKFGTSGDSLENARALLSSAARAGACLVCHNAGFDALILKLRWGIEFEHLFDTACYARYLGLAAALSNVGEHLGFKKIDHPPFDEASLRSVATLDRFARYNCTDVALARECFKVALADEHFPDAEFEAIDLTSRLGLEGLRVDRGRAKVLAREFVCQRNELLAAFSREFDFDTTWLNSVAKKTSFIETRFQVKVGSLRQTDVQLQALGRQHPQLDRFLTQARNVVAIGKRAKQLEEYAALSGRIYAPLRYHGARTGRFAGGGRDSDRINIQALPKTDNPAKLPILGKMRSIIAPNPGKMFRAADLSTIEARVLAFLAGEEALLAQFRSDIDIYIWFAGLVFPGVQVDSSGPNKHLRKLAKQAVLGLGYGMGLATFFERIQQVDPTADEILVRRVFDGYQQRFGRIKALRMAFARAFIDAASRGLASRVSGCVFWRHASNERQGRTVVVDLPTGRSLFYRSIEVLDATTPRGVKQQYWFADQYSYDARMGTRVTKGLNHRKSKDGRVRSELKPQLIVENVTQAVARDLLVHQMLEVARTKPGGIRPVFHVHDELVVECEACGCEPSPNGGRSHTDPCAWLEAGKALKRAMSCVPATLPALQGLPVGCKLSDEVCEGYAG